jgi:tetratricopeptide (TPR) repeat protein
LRLAAGGSRLAVDGYPAVNPWVEGVRIVSMCPTSRVEKLFDEALMALRKMRYNLAFDLFTEVMELEPEIPEVHYNRGLAAGHLLKWEEAAQNFSMALRMTSDTDSFLQRAIARLHLRDWDGALRDLDAVLAQERENELGNYHRRDLVLFLERTGRKPEDVPFHCVGWFDPRLKDFVGVDPEIVPKAERAGLRAYLVEALKDAAPAGCDHSFRFTEEWALENRRDPRGVSRFLFERGMRCDCQVVAEPERSPSSPAG